jgi:hypothetical protein
VSHDNGDRPDPKERPDDTGRQTAGRALCRAPPLPAPVEIIVLTLPCFLCGARDGHISVRIDEGYTCTCGDCGEDFTLADVEAFCQPWMRLLAWRQEEHPCDH